MKNNKSLKILTVSDTVDPELKQQSVARRFAGVDLILASHFHGDHFDAASVARHLRANPEAVFLSTNQAVAELCEQILGKKAGSVLCTRRMLRPRELESRLAQERARFVEQIVTDEAKSGINSWLGDE